MNKSYFTQRGYPLRTPTCFSFDSLQIYLQYQQHVVSNRVPTPFMYDAQDIANSD